MRSQTVDVTAAAAHQIPKLLFAGRNIKLAMKVVVGGREFRQIAGLGELLLERNGQISSSLLWSSAGDPTTSSSSACHRTRSACPLSSGTVPITNRQRRDEVCLVMAINDDGALQWIAIAAGGRLRWRLLP
jgi:hypothetical protein